MSKHSRDEDWPLDVLTPRLIEVLTMTAEGLTQRQIAEQLGIGFKTVDHYRQELSKRLQLSGIANLTRYAVRAGLVDGERSYTADEVNAALKEFLCLIESGHEASAQIAGAIMDGITKVHAIDGCTFRLRMVKPAAEPRAKENKPWG